MLLSDQIATLRRLFNRSRRPDGSIIVPAQHADDLDDLLETFAARAEALEKRPPVRDLKVNEVGNIILFPNAARKRAPGGAA